MPRMVIKIGLHALDRVISPPTIAHRLLNDFSATTTSVRGQALAVMAVTLSPGLRLKRMVCRGRSLQK